MMGRRLAKGALLLLCAGLLCLPGCEEDEEETSSASVEETIPATTVNESEAHALIYVGESDPAAAGANGEKSPALALYESQYGGTVEWVPCTSENRWLTIESRQLVGEPPDMTGYAREDFPAQKENLAPLGEYLDLSDPLWEEMKYAADALAYAGEYYVIPYTAGDPTLLFYSRKTCEEMGFEDPYTLYEAGTWDWDAFLGMMREFTAAGSGRAGICGEWGTALAHSTGKAFFSLEGGTPASHLEDPSIAAAENFLAKVQGEGLYDAEFYGSYPADGHVLFYAMEDWALAASGARTPELDLMPVPFPRPSEKEDYVLSGGFEAKLLLQGSEKGAAVADYLRCERMVREDEGYRAAQKKAALAGEKAFDGSALSILTEEQYTALETIKTSLRTVPEIGFGLDGMYKNGDYTFETRGVMNNLSDALFTYPDKVSSWDALREILTPQAETILAAYAPA